MHRKLVFSEKAVFVNVFCTQLSQMNCKGNLDISWQVMLKSVLKGFMS